MNKNFKASLIVVSICILLMAALMSGAIQSDRWKINSLELNAGFKRVSAEQIRVAIAASKERSFFKIDIEHIKQALKQIPWVKRVDVKKKWPNTLIVNLVEHEAFAIWNQNQLLNYSGDIFSVESTENLSLPQIQGSDNQAKEILQKFSRFKELIATTGFDIKKAIVSPRGSWSIELNNGIQINLGSQQKDSRIIRLKDTWISLLKKNNDLPQYIDLRYTNGYAVKWKQQTIESNDSDDDKNEIKDHFNG